MIKKIFINKLLLLPLLVVVLMSLFLIIFLLQEKKSNKPPSALLDKDLPIFLTKSLYNKHVYLSSDNLKKNVNLSSDQNVYISSDDLKRKYTLINFFASWCTPCRAEHNLFFKIKKDYPELFLLGFAHKDEPSNSKKYLSEEGNPYSFVGLDQDGKIALEFGVFGLPETFIADSDGKIIYKHIGPLNKEILIDEIYPLLQ